MISLIPLISFQFTAGYLRSNSLFVILSRFWVPHLQRQVSYKHYPINHTRLIHIKSSTLWICEVLAIIIERVSFICDKVSKANSVSNIDSLPLDSFTKQLIHPVSKTNDIHRTSQQFFQFAFQMEREKPLRLTLVINIYITTFRQIPNYAIVVKYCNNLPFLSHPSPSTYFLIPYRMLGTFAPFTNVRWGKRALMKARLLTSLRGDE